MPIAKACPNAQQWQQIEEWELTDPEAELFAEHLEECASCALSIERLAKQTSIVRAPRTQLDAMQMPDQAHIETVISRLRKLAGPSPTIVESDKVVEAVSTWSIDPNSTEVRNGSQAETQMAGEKPALPHV